jgi:7-cyano-7-deazaguanine synthase
VASSSALVLFSGGQDSTVCLAWALERYEHVETVGFTYGQRHIVEIEQRAVILSKLAEFDEVGQRLGPDTVLELAALKSVSDTALTRETEITFAATGLPTTFVPARNLLFLTYAAALAYRRGIDTLVGGMCETDFSGYPDCRNDTVQALAKALSLGLGRPMTIETPLMFLDKAGTWELASSLGGEKLVDLIIEDTHTCYLGDRSHRHPWGFGCGQCPACELRARGWTAWQARTT